MNPGKAIAYFGVNHPVWVTVIMLGLTLLLALLAGLPSLWPETFSMLSAVKVDTDPENMLREDEAVRVFHDHMKEVFSLYDMVVLGVVNEEHEEGVFNPASLEKIYELTQYAKTLRWEDEDHPDKKVGVIEIDLIAPSTVDNIEQGSLGQVKFEWLMKKPPQTQEEATAIREKAQNIPFLNGTLVSEDGKAIALYIPLTSKDLSYKVSTRLQEKISEFEGPERFLITGLPVAEDTFGVQMFKQMAISAPLAMLVIFLLMLFFFRKLSMIISPMIVATVSVIQTMGLLVTTGQTVHIMSSMIPIFIMPIAVLDAIHILSEYFDRYQKDRDRKTTILEVMESLGNPMLFTSLTTMAGFASLALTPIPPVQVFGVFVAFGVLMAWLWTVTFIPAYLLFIPSSWLENFGMKSGGKAATSTFLSRLLKGLGQWTFNHASLVIVLTVALGIVSAYGISLIRINDNPTKWFEPEHPIRVADRILNDHFGGTYMAFLTFDYEPEEQTLEQYASELSDRLQSQGEKIEDVSGVEEVFSTLSRQTTGWVEDATSETHLLGKLRDYANRRYEEVPWEEAEAWDEALIFLDREQLRHQAFKRPEVLTYVENLQKAMLKTEVVGKINTLTDIVKTVHRELFLGKPEEFKIPDSSDAVAQTLITFQNSHRPQDLWHFVTPDYRRTNLWFQLKSGDNQNMQKLTKHVDRYVSENPPPVELEKDWFGLTYINVVWQDKMVSGMLHAFLGSFLVVLLMMIFLFRSALWGVLSMIPLLVTIGFIYGVIGLIGKDYDMPVAVLSSLSLGLAVDYAIHFLARSRELHARSDSWKDAVGKVFGEPARAISRNVIVVGVGFLPLLAAPLVPYQTVGIFIAAILFMAGVASLIVLPAVITLLEGWLFPTSDKRKFTCKCGTIIVASITAIALVVVNLWQFFEVGWTQLTWISAGTVLVMLIACRLLSGRKACNV